ncbi:DUF488 domain-containing protein [Geomonas anaerohicana]|uniref:DUF488 domain-containing protein n=1 Tax=Geomonas anaerohicana TaxID=2798583 RepID=A0ABS0YCW9_9BACT|nr:DUF488 domain-containing protein [Geomonas anaerohicana]MBJ6750144.1 DUF488 domain-containing protein [Geomonas anaerohicana]
MIRLKRIYDEAAAQDGVRVLVDRLWPRGISKDKAHLDRWEKELAPSDELRHWFGHDPEKWQEFRARYRKELEGQGTLIEELAALAAGKTLTLLYAAKDEEHNNAVVLKEILEDSSIG